LLSGKSKENKDAADALRRESVMEDAETERFIVIV